MAAEEFLTVSEAAARLKVDRETVRVWLRSGRLKGTRLSRAAGWRIPESAIGRLLTGDQDTDAKTAA